MGRLLTVFLLLTLSLWTTNGMIVKVLTKDKQDILIGQHFTIKCEFVDIDPEDIIIWKRNESPLFMEGIAALSDDRYQIVEDEVITNGKKVSEMTVSRIGAIEDANFSCGTMNTDEYYSTRIKVLVPPTAHISPEVWPYVVLVGEPVTLHCHASGNPQPTITWSKKEGAISSHASVEKDSIRIPAVNKLDSGIYSCTVTSKAGTDTAMVDMRVQEPHKLTPGVSKPWIKTAFKYVPIELKGSVNISCSYDGNPSPQIEWLFNGARLSMAEEMVRTSIKQYATRHETYSESILEINDATADYFGDYSCRVSNEHGDNSTVIFVTAFPSPPVLSVDGTMLTITAQAPNGIDEFGLYFRRPDESGWINKKTIPLNKGDSVSEKAWSKKINLLEYIDNGKYEIQVQARNGYGWGNKASDMIRVDLLQRDPESKSASSFIMIPAALLFSLVAF